MLNFVFLRPKRRFQLNFRIVRTHFASIMTLNNLEMIAETRTRSYVFRWRSRRRLRHRKLQFLQDGDARRDVTFAVVRSAKRDMTALAVPAKLFMVTKQAVLMFLRIRAQLAFKTMKIFKTWVDKAWVLVLVFATTSLIIQEYNWYHWKNMQLLFFHL